MCSTAGKRAPLAAPGGRKTLAVSCTPSVAVTRRLPMKQVPSRGETTPGMACGKV
jgi:hypothetical protein